MGLSDTPQTGADSRRWSAAHGWMVETRGLMVHCFLGMEGCATGQILHGCTTTTEAVRRAIQHSQESLRICRSAPKDKDRKTTSLSLEDEAIIVAFRQQTLLPLGDCPYGPSGDDPAPGALVFAPLPAAACHLAAPGRRGRQEHKGASSRPIRSALPHRHR